MKYLKTLFLSFVLLASGCAFHSQYGKCIGLLDQPDPNLEYEVSIGNAFWTIVGFEMVIPPVVWAVSCVKCPVGPKPVPVSCLDPLDKDCLRLSLNVR